MLDRILIVLQDRALIHDTLEALEHPDGRPAEPVVVSDPEEAVRVSAEVKFKLAIVDPTLSITDAYDEPGLVSRLLASNDEMGVIAVSRWTTAPDHPPCEKAAHHYVFADRISSWTLWSAIDAATSISLIHHATKVSDLASGGSCDEVIRMKDAQRNLDEKMNVLAHDLSAPLRTARMFADRASSDPANASRWLARIDVALEEAVEINRTLVLEQREEDSGSHMKGYDPCRSCGINAPVEWRR